MEQSLEQVLEFVENIEKPILIDSIRIKTSNSSSIKGMGLQNGKLTITSEGLSIGIGKSNSSKFIANWDNLCFTGTRPYIGTHLECVFYNGSTPEVLELEFTQVSKDAEEILKNFFGNLPKSAIDLKNKQANKIKRRNVRKRSLKLIFGSIFVGIIAFFITMSEVYGQLLGGPFVRGIMTLFGVVIILMAAISFLFNLFRIIRGK